ncbi:hypothetical protein KR100_03135 [Synechococcus sp. KORDI-100]|nr:hypothetical protein KR100_03135 [Synechococcus sp. KORDI-100]
MLSARLSIVALLAVVTTAFFGLRLSSESAKGGFNSSPRPSAKELIRNQQI